MKYSASVEDGEQMTALDEKLMAPHKSPGEDSARVDQASAARADSSRPHLLMLGWRPRRCLRPVSKPISPPSWLFPARNYTFSFVTQTSKLPEPEPNTYFSSADDLSQDVMTCFFCAPNPTAILNQSDFHCVTQADPALPSGSHSHISNRTGITSTRHFASGINSASTVLLRISFTHWLTNSPGNRSTFLCKFVERKTTNREINGHLQRNAWQMKPWAWVLEPICKKLQPHTIAISTLKKNHYTFGKMHRKLSKWKYGNAACSV